MSRDIALSFAGMPAFNTAPAHDPQQSLDRSLRQALILVLVLIVVIALMASVIRVTGAVIGSGRLSVESSVKRIAHPSGGVIAQLFVREGDRVRKGQPLMRFDNRVSGDSAATLGQSLEQLLAAHARLTAERDGSATVLYPSTLTSSTAASARQAMAEADRLFAARRSLRATESRHFAPRPSSLRVTARPPKRRPWAAAAFKILLPALETRGKLISLHRVVPVLAADQIVTGSKRT